MFITYLFPKKSCIDKWFFEDKLIKLGGYWFFIYLFNYIYGPLRANYRRYALGYSKVHIHA